MKTLVLFLMSLSIFAQVDLSQYDLKTSQIEIIRKFEASGKYTEEFLHKFARAAHNQNQAEIRRQNMYIPEYTEDELRETILWARGGAFAAYADYAGFRFLGEAYRADCPNVGLFRFGRASGTEFIPQDVMREAINTSHALQTAYARDRDQFPHYFIELAKKYGFAIYLEKVED